MARPAPPLLDKARPLSDEEVVGAPLYRPAEDSPEALYVAERRRALGGPVPARRTAPSDLPRAADDLFEEFRTAQQTVAFQIDNPNNGTDVKQKCIETLALIEEGSADIIVGTQALLTQTVKFKSLAVVVVDEQHRFGVQQRSALRDRGGDGDGQCGKRTQHDRCNGDA